MRVQSPTYELNAHGIRVPGDATNDQPGAPALPVWSTVVELPANGDWRITTQTPGARLLDQGVDVAAVPVPDLAPPGPHGWTAVSYTHLDVYKRQEVHAGRYRRANSRRRI